MSIELHRCPNCRRPLQVTELACSTCDLRLQGHFERGCKFCALEPEQRHLLEVFLSCRGVIRDIEKALDLSYPTVRARVDALLRALGYLPEKSEGEEQENAAVRRQEILSRLEAGEITADEAAAALREVGA